MKPDRWQQVEQLYHSALEREPSQRASFLEEACRGDEALRREVESLLARQSEAANFMETPTAKALAETHGLSLLGQQIGSYKVLSVLGSGGMGQVYRARDAKLRRDVAIKVLPREFSSDRERVRRFEQEARAASALNHPNIITIHDIGEVDSVHYMVMELVEGKTLREVLGSGPLPTKRILQLSSQVADGLAKAHAAGITHRDLKPENLMITKEGLVKILDFGLAKQARLSAGGPGSEGGRNDGDVTEPGILLGTVGYMSPEQAQGQGVDFRSDQFSLGAILYEMVTGERAFVRSSSAETLAAIIREEPKPIAELSPKALIQLRWMIERCLGKDPDDRFASTRDLARELQVLRDRLVEVEGSKTALPVVASSLARTRQAKALMLIGIVAAVVAFSTGAFFLGRGLVQAPPTFQRLTFRHGLITSARFAGDGNTVIYGATFGGKNSELYATRPESPESRSLDLHDAGIFSISSSGEMAIALGCTLNWGECVGTLARVPPSGGAPRPIMDNVLYADWAPDGKEPAVVSLKGERSYLEYPPGKVLYEAAGWISHLRISPKGDAITFLDHPVRHDFGGSVCVVDLAGQKKTLSAGWRSLWGLAWHPSGDEVWFSGSRGRRGQEGLQAVTLRGLERTILEPLGGVNLFDVSRDGQRVLLKRVTSMRAWVIGLPPGGATERDLSWLDWSTAADLSTDGKTLLFYEWGPGVRGTFTVYLRKTDGSDPVRLGEGKPLALSPDGKWALVLQETSPPQLVLLPTGTGEQKLLSRGPIHKYTDWAAWSPDGGRVFFTGSEQGRRERTYVQEITGGEPRPVTAEGLVGTLLSPDGKLVAATDRYGEHYLCPVAGGEPGPIDGLEDGDGLVQWSGDGRSLFVRGAGDLILKIYKLDLASGGREFWKALTPPDPATLVGIGANPGELKLTPDGKAYAYTYWSGTVELYLAQGLK